MLRLRLADIGLTLLACATAGAAVFAVRPPTPPVGPAAPVRAVQAVFLGDDSLGPPASGSAAVAARLLGWEAAVRTQAGSGFVAGEPVGDVAARVPAAVSDDTDVLVLLAGINDRPVLETRLDTAVRRAVAAARAALPAGGSLVLVGPYGTTLVPDLPIRRVRNAVRLVAEDENLPFIDPLEPAWLVPDAGYLQADGLHPTPVGDEAFGRRLAVALERLQLTPSR